MALRSTRPYGKSITVSIFFDNSVPIPYIEMYTKGIDLTISRTHARETNARNSTADRRKEIRPGGCHEPHCDFGDAAEAWVEPGESWLCVGCKR
jgi:hypothetical protein